MQKNSHSQRDQGVRFSQSTHIKEFVDFLSLLLIRPHSFHETGKFLPLTREMDSPKERIIVFLSSPLIQRVLLFYGVVYAVVFSVPYWTVRTMYGTGVFFLATFIYIAPLLCSIFYILYRSGKEVETKAIISAILNVFVFPVVSLPFTICFLALIFPSIPISWKLMLAVLSFLFLGVIAHAATTYFHELYRGTSYLRMIPRNAVVLSLLFSPLVVTSVIFLSLKTSDSALFLIALVTIVLLINFLFLFRVPLWAILQLLLLWSESHHDKTAPFLHMENCWLPELYLAARIYQHLKEDTPDLKRILWVTRFPTQRWAVRKALILLWRESPEKVVELLKRIRADEQWQTALTEHDDAVLSRNIEPTVWEEVLLCELFDVQIDKDILRWYERIMFAPERWLRKSKTLYPPCPTELKELALERVQPLMLQREQALQEYLEANPNSASS